VLTVLLGAAAPTLVVGGLLLAAGGADDGDAAREPAATSTPATARSVAAEPAPSAPSPPASEPAPRLGVRPRAVVVPSLGVTAVVTSIRTEDGALTPPPDPRQAGWWSGGARPGADAGAAVITAHTVHTGGGAFDDLETLSPGDDVVVRAEKRRVAYEVTSVEVLSRDALARSSARIFGRTGAPRLVLITCEDWDGTGYRSNVVVTARPP
jgi:LPXTG-site transpeptidase (sortase) family protein